MVLAARKYKRWQRHKLLRKLQLAQSKRELEEMSKGWEIRPEDITWNSRIDINSRGACGEVWSAQLYGHRVAVKKLNKALLELDAEVAHLQHHLAALE
jgi:hypothetical protein